MYRVKKVKVLEAQDNEWLEREINNYIKQNRNEEIMDIKYTVFERDVEPQFRDNTDGDKEIIYSALILVGEEV